MCVVFKILKYLYLYREQNRELSSNKIHAWSKFTTRPCTIIFYIKIKPYKILRNHINLILARLFCTTNCFLRTVTYISNFAETQSVYSSKDTASTTMGMNP